MARPLENVTKKAEFKDDAKFSQCGSSEEIGRRRLWSPSKGKRPGSKKQRISCLGKKAENRGE